MIYDTGGGMVAKVSLGECYTIIQWSESEYKVDDVLISHNFGSEPLLPGRAINTKSASESGAQSYDNVNATLRYTDNNALIIRNKIFCQCCLNHLRAFRNITWNR